MTDHERIIVDPNILSGKPVVKGTRLSVELIVNLLSEGWTDAEITDEYPGLTKEEVAACAAYVRSQATRLSMRPWVPGRKLRDRLHMQSGSANAGDDK